LIFSAYDAVLKNLFYIFYAMSINRNKMKLQRIQFLPIMSFSQLWMPD
ncbi:hypothetical protein EC54115_25022, partial [Escherichia coli 541-15]